MSAILHNYSMEYCKSLRISLFECTTLTQSALYLTCECALIGTRKPPPRCAPKFVIGILNSSTVLRGGLLVFYNEMYFTNPQRWNPPKNQ